MYQTVYTAVILWVMLDSALGQQPLNVGMGQYCSNYANGFTSNLGGTPEIFLSTYALLCSCTYNGFGANPATPACSWEGVKIVVP
jgi:hypothetical protein